MAWRTIPGQRPADGDDVSVWLVRADLFTKVGIECSAKSLVRRDNKEEFLVTFALFKKNVGFFVDVLLEVDEDLVEQVRVVASCNRLVLRLLHLGGSDKLHRPRDLGGVLYRLNASADVAKVGHESKNQESEVREESIISKNP